ncbi:MAG: sensor domain-containing diguanylate cyclase [Desulfatibacillum sp.]|nr:sensor domain-containing diguanylate cyclase [Desulfatibacillum sp.]
MHLFKKTDLTDTVEFYKSLLDKMLEGVYFVTPDRVITYWNSGAEKLTGYKASEVIGKTCSHNIIMHVDRWGHNLCGTGSCPAQKTMQDGKAREVAVSYHHKDGHLVPAVARFIPFRDANGAIVGAVEVFHDTTPLMCERDKADHLRRLSLVDPLTNLANRRFAEIRMAAKLNEFSRYGWPFGILFCDVDDLKQVNTLYGRAVGDNVLKAIGKTLEGNLRTSDFISRWGDDEFLIILANVDKQTLGRVAQKVERLVANTKVHLDPVDRGKVVNVTNSIGGVIAQSDDTVERLLQRADELMYRSRHAGVNQVSE